MGDKYAATIGSALASCIVANLTAQAAVEEWISRYPAMRELDQEFAWFRHMVRRERNERLTNSSH